MLFIVVCLFKTLGNSFLNLQRLFEEALCFPIKGAVRMGHVPTSYYFLVCSAVRMGHVTGSYCFPVMRSIRT
jgi:hypothetical protein